MPHVQFPTGCAVGKVLSKRHFQGLWDWGSSSKSAPMLRCRYLLMDASDAANVCKCAFTVRLSGCIGRCLSMIVVLNSRFLMTRLEMQHDWHQCHGHTNSHTQFCHVLSICLSFFPLVVGAIQPAHQVELMTRLNCVLSSRTIFFIYFWKAVACVLPEKTPLPDH